MLIAFSIRVFEWPFVTIHCIKKFFFKKTPKLDGDKNVRHKHSAYLLLCPTEEFETTLGLINNDNFIFMCRPTISLLQLA